MTLNENVKHTEAKRRAQDLANWYRENYYPLPLDITFPGLRVHVVAEKIVSAADTKPLRYDEDEQRAD